MSEYRIINGELYHHGIKGQKWGVRRFQTKDGSLTPAGKKRYITTREAHINARNAAKESIAADRARGGVTVRQASKNAKAARKASIAADKAYNKELRNTPEAKAARKEKAVKAAKVGAAVAGTALAAYGAKKVHDYVRDKNTQIHIEKAQKLTEDWFSKQVKDLYANEAITGKLDHDLAGKVLDYVDKSKRRNDIASGRMMAKKDKFSTAAKNVAFDYLEKRKYYG